MLGTYVWSVRKTSLVSIVMGMGHVIILTNTFKVLKAYFANLIDTTQNETLTYQNPIFDEYFMMTSSNGNIFRVTGPLCGEFTGPAEFPAQGQWRGTLMFSLICARIND